MAHQLREVDRLIGDHTGSLVLLSECALSGYLDENGRCDLRPFAEDAVRPGEDLTIRCSSGLASLAQIAIRTSNVIVAPCVERAGDEFFNSAVVIDSSGRALTRYRKRHPWYPETWATPGDEPIATFEYAGRHVAIAICFDVHFLAEESPAMLAATDLLLFPSAWVDDTAADARGPLLRELAARFDLTIANTNWGHGTPRVRGQGASRVVRPDGTQDVLRTTGSDVLVVTL